MLLIWYPKCSTCQKAKKHLEKKDIPFALRDITLETPSRKELKDYIKRSDKDINKFFNTSGLKYRELKLKDKLSTMSDEEKLELLSKDGMLIKRPLLVCNDKVLVGFKEKEWSELNENS